MHELVAVGSFISDYSVQFMRDQSGGIHLSLDDDKPKLCDFPDGIQALIDVIQTPCDTRIIFTIGGGLRVLGSWDTHQRSFVICWGSSGKCMVSFSSLAARQALVALLTGQVYEGQLLAASLDGWLVYTKSEQNHSSAVAWYAHDSSRYCPEVVRARIAEPRNIFHVNKKVLSLCNHDKFRITTRSQAAVDIAAWLGECDYEAM